MDEATLHQIQLLLQSNQGKQDISKRIDVLVTLLIGLSDGNEKQIYEAIGAMLQTDSSDLLAIATAMIDYVVAPVAGNIPEETLALLKRSYTTELYRQLRDPVYKDDSSSPVSEIKKLRNSAIRENRRGIFERANFQTMDAASSYDDERKNGYVIWRARTQADGQCQAYNGLTMTVDEFKSLYPIHYNCMCTAELIPETMNVDKAMSRRYKEK